MAVNLNKLDLGGASASSARNASVSAGTTQSTSTSAQDATQQSGSEVAITSTAALLARLQQALAAKPAIDWAAVEAIRTALDAGSYKVNPDKVASGLMDNERALGKLDSAEA